MLEAKGVYKKFAEVIALDDVSFTLEKGKILGLLGKNGAGKSTMFRIILGILEADKRQVLIDGKKYSIKDSKKIGFLPEEGSLSQELTVYEQLCFYGSLKGMSNDEVLEGLKKWLVKFDIVEYMNRKIKELSKGNRQRIQFIVSILHDQELIILDEQFSGLDPLGVEMFKDIVLELKREGKAIIFSSHRMEHVELFCDDILLIDKGKTLCYGSLEQIKKDYPKQKLVYEINGKKYEKYILKESSQEDIQKINGENLHMLPMSLNDIFIDKVGALE